MKIFFLIIFTLVLVMATVWAVSFMVKEYQVQKRDEDAKRAHNLRFYKLVKNVEDDGLDLDFDKYKYMGEKKDDSNN